MLQIRDFIDEQVRNAQELINGAGILAHIFMTPSLPDEESTNFRTDQPISNPISLVHQAERQLAFIRTVPGLWNSLRQEFYFANRDGLDEMLDTIDALQAPMLAQFFQECGEHSSIEVMLDNLPAFRP